MDGENGVVVDYTYDDSGNILSKVTRSWNSNFSSPVIGSVVSDITYSYTDSEWKDMLTSYNGQTLTYDAIGNPLNYRDGITLTWQNGRQLASYSQANGASVTYTYDAGGMRTGKTVTKGTTTDTVEYVYENGMLLQMRYNYMIFDFIYDANGAPVSMAYRTSSTATPTYYYYGLNSRGDVVVLYNSNGSVVARYSYDAYGKLLSVTSANGASITATYAVANLNPLRYRGYVYDNETGFYYLNSRYYDPITYRFVSADTTDILTATFTAHTDKNLFAYCDNNPISRIDTDGDFWITACISAGISLVSTYVGDVVENVQNGKTGLEALKPTSSVGEYIGGAASAFIPGTGFGSYLLGNVVEEGVPVILDLINGKEVDLGKSIMDVAVNTVVDSGVGFVSGKVTKYIESKKPINYSTYAHEVRKTAPNLTRQEISSKMVKALKFNRIAVPVAKHSIDFVFSTFWNIKG